MIDRYRKQVRLLLQVLPIVAKQKQFALKGGTAINFFWRNFPRLSVDIDLTYVPIKDREESLYDIKDGVQQIAEEISERIPGTTINSQESGGTVSRLIIRGEDAQIKLEVNTVLRGTIFDPIEKELTTKVQDEFELFTANQTLSFADIYGGKICAALDRQHPRDLYDVKLLVENEGILNEIRTAFIGYIIGHSRPLYELLDPNFIELDEVFENEFEGMTNESVKLEDLIEIQRELPRIVLKDLTEVEKDFLLSFQQKDPKWDLISIEHLKDLPGVRWKLFNIKKMDDHKHQLMKKKLEWVLEKG